MKKVTTLIFTLFMVLGSSSVSSASSTADVNAQLIEAIQKNSLDDVLAALDKGADANYSFTEGYQPSRVSALELAVKKNNIKIIEALLDRGANSNKKNFYGNTPLCYTWDCEIINVLLCHGANPDTTCAYRGELTPFDGPTLLHRAVHRGNLDIAGLLIQKGANINLADQPFFIDLKQAPLHVAAEEGSLDAVRFLLDRGALINIRDSRGNTPLHLAVENDFPEVARFLLQQGAAQ